MRAYINNNGRCRARLEEMAVGIFLHIFSPRYINIAMYNNDNISYDPPPCLSLTETAQHEINADGFGLLTVVLVEEERDS